MKQELLRFEGSIKEGFNRSMNNRVRASMQARESVESSFKVYEQNRRSLD